MLTAVLGIVAALAFVLGLGALCIWALKRWGAGTLTPRSRVAVEVVQRIALGPKTGLAVVRVGDKVMALSVGEGGVRQLFELDEADRQRVIATSTIPTPMVSSAAASAAFPAAALPGKFGALLGRAISGHAAQPVAATSAPATGGMSAPMAPVVSTAATFAPAPFALGERAEIPSFLTAPLTTSRGAAVTYARSTAPVAAAPAAPEFRRMLGVSMSGATRLAVLAGAMILLGAPALSAQVAPPPAPPVVTAAPTVSAPNTQPPAPSPALSPALSPSLNPQPPVAPRPIARPSANRGPARTATPATAAVPNTGNGAATAPQGVASQRPASQMVVQPAPEPSNGAAPAAAPAPIAADDAIMRMMPQMDVKLGGDGEDGGLRLNGTVGIVVMMGLLTLLPTLLLMMTGFTRILIVLHFLKQAMGTQSAPPGQLLAGLALLLTGFVMTPTLSQMNREAITPWLDGKITQVEMMKTGVVPMREFMVRQTRESDIASFVAMSRMEQPATVDDVPLHVLMSAFVASELRTAFQIGFAIYLPFIIIDAVVASVLMSMGMFMLPPAMISLPFKLLLFVLVDGWSLTITSLVQSFK